MPDSQTYRVVRTFKADRPAQEHIETMKALLALGLRGHTACLGRLAGIGMDGWAVVPSTRGRPALHDLVAGVSSKPALNLTVQFNGTGGERSFAPNHWNVAVPADRKHVLVIDDSWVTGSHAQSVAASLKKRGVEQVSIFTVARVLDPGWEPNRAFIKERLGGGTFDWTRCPWTGGDCPD